MSATGPAVAARLPRCAKLLLHLTLSGRYGYHGDELYFIESGKHLAFGIEITEGCDYLCQPNTTLKDLSLNTSIGLRI
jgi:hypothetical protein